VSPFEVAFNNLLAWEGSTLSLDPFDPGNFTPAGVLLGSRYGVSARSYPDEDIPNMTPERAAEIFKLDYWDRIDADNLPAPLAVLASDAAFNQGVGKAQEWLTLCGGDYITFYILRQNHYTEDLKEMFKIYGRGWTRRNLSVLGVAHALARTAIPSAES
jgi:lysozyme family protein